MDRFAKSFSRRSPSYDVAAIPATFLPQQKRPILQLVVQQARPCRPSSVHQESLLRLAMSGR